MYQHEIQQSDQDWLGLTKLASLLGARQAPGDSRDSAGADREVIDRLHRTLEILTLVEEHAGALRAHARATTEHDAMQIAVELRRLANRLQSIGNFLSNAGDSALELENQLLAELDERYRAQSARHHAA
jgi:hypothetical protein